MAERGVVVSYETVRAWCSKFGREYAKRLRRNRGRLGDTWHLDEVYLKIDGRFQYLWRAVDQEGQVVDILVQSRRDTGAAKRFFRKLLGKECTVPNRVITDRLGSYGAAMRQLIPKVEHIQNKGANNRAENSHQPTRERERRRSRFRSASEAQRFLSTFSAISNQFREGRHLIQASTHRALMTRRFAEWRVICGSVA
ncbi:unnamed protein product [Chondrus crispus]|uniref:DDE domain-containing protein n=1 Tax=Chondrus crispus TaxID=2769 RepID=R7Q9Q5_CHOCR|nr:unnamed protein product [Chondrus crispus]CDF34483.1 unnamed protein product [Chondrus crispus]|eukprot:XP_005714302.1 unnamed protein product [Chondrus crispus]